jgi:hypothetical protein
MTVPPPADGPDEADAVWSDATTAEGLPTTATRRLGHGAWSSGLSVADFATGLSLGLQPVGFVQGYCAMQWSWYTAYGTMGGFGMPQQTGRSEYSESWTCPHGYVSAEHRSYGYNFEQAWVEDSWSEAWGLAYQRMVAEAVDAGAHGVIGVVDDMRALVGSRVNEFRIQGTAVVVTGADPPPAPFTTYLSGQRLAKLVEAGFFPVEVVATVSSVQMYAYCMTQYQLSGTGATRGWGGGTAGAGVTEVTQVARAERAARQLARERARRQLGGDLLHGVTLQATETEIGEGAMSIQCQLKGNRVRRFKPWSPLPQPSPVVRLT